MLLLFWCVAGSHTRGTGQMDTNRRRDLGQSDSTGEEPSGGQSLRPSACTHYQRIRRWI